MWLSENKQNSGPDIHGHSLFAHDDLQRNCWSMSLNATSAVVFLFCKYIIKEKLLKLHADILKNTCTKPVLKEMTDL